MKRLKENKVRMAISSDFFDSFAKIPRTQQLKVIQFIEKFKSNPTASGINYEKIKNARDSQLHSVRIDGTYRGIIHKPQNDNIYLLLWVALHDKAYEWAQNRICRINPETGSIQVYSVTENQQAAAGPAAAEKLPGLFDIYRDRQLLKLGVPSEFLGQVRSVTKEGQLEELDEVLPQEASEALYMLAAGFSEEDVYRELDLTAPAAVDTGDYRAALANNDTLRRFYVVEDELELQAIFNAPLEKWRVFLHPSQRKLVERNWDGAIRVLGGAGTGKTVAAVHRARWLAEKCFSEPGDRILFTTYTRNLAADIRQNLAKICPVDVMKRIEVVNLDKWVLDFLQQQDYPYTIHFHRPDSRHWANAMIHKPTKLDFDDTFYREEWEKVIQVRGIESLAEYFRTTRIGRGTRISRLQKKEIWPVFDRYRELLAKDKLRERDDALRDARQFLENQNITLPYRAVVVDEAQDMGTQAFKLIARILPGDLPDGIFIVGDPHQRIYKAKVTLSQCGINIRGRRSHRLRINYRTTEETRKWARDILDNQKIDDMDGGEDHQKGYRSLVHGNPPLTRNFDSFEAEASAIYDYIETLTKNNAVKLEDICLVARTKDLLRKYKNYLESRGIRIYKLKSSRAEDRDKDGLRIATMHRVKGLEFDHIMIAAVNKRVVPLQEAMISDDPAAARENEQIERSLLYVSASRARKDVFITSSGEASEFIAGLSI
ncbi:MAG: AAA family ATPase [bacterium]|nr:AAA family ATPase [bacterium]